MSALYRVSAQLKCDQLCQQSGGIIKIRKVAGMKAKTKIKWIFLTYLFLRSEFVFLDYEESRLLFILNHLALLGLCIVLAHYGSRFLKNAGRRSKKEAVD